MSERFRDAILIVGLLGLGAMLVWGLHGLRPFGHYDGIYGMLVNAVAPNERQIENVVTAVNFDYRGFDTLGEEFILFTAVAGVALLMREMRGPDIADTLPQPEPGSLPLASLAVRAWAALFTPLTWFFGAYIVLLAHITVGGGFQGGCALSTAWMLVYLAGGDRHFHDVAARDKLEVFEALGAGAFALIGAIAVLTGAQFLYNFLPKGSIGNVNSAGTIPVINAFVGLEVCAGFLLLYGDFISQLAHRVTRPRGSATSS